MEKYNTIEVISEMRRRKPGVIYSHRNGGKMKDKIYIIISKTPTRFAYLIRRFGKAQYNHAAISMDAELKEIYSFARPQYKGVLLAKLVHESYEGYTLGKSEAEGIIFELSVTEEEYQWVKKTIFQIQQDSEVLYNLFSVLLYPVLGGMETYKAYTCIEFVMFILENIGYSLERPICKYKPDDLMEILSKCAIYKGDIGKYLQLSSRDENYFEPLTKKQILLSGITLWKLSKRLIFRRRYQSDNTLNTHTG